MKKFTNIFKIVKTVVDVIGSILCTIKRNKDKEQNPTSDEKLAVSVTQG